jgi:hypothetical protein
VIRNVIWVCVGLFLGSISFAIGQFGGTVPPSTFLGNVGGSQAPAAPISLSHAFSFANLQQIPAYTYPCNNTASTADMQNCTATAPTPPLYTDGATIWIHQGAWISTGPVPVVSGTCSPVTAQGGGTAVGRFTSPACNTGNSMTLTFNVTGMSPAPSAWVCEMYDLTTPGALMKQTAYTPTSVTFTNQSGGGTNILNGDLITFACQGMQ